MTTPRKPKAPVDYSKARLYVIRSPHIDKVYIGATTTQLSKRFYEHKKNYKQWTNGKCRYITSFEIIQAGGAYIELLKECPCENKEQLARYEGEAIRDMPNCCNKVIPDRTKSGYYEDNKEIIKQHKKQYYEANKDKIKEYYEANKQQIKEYYEANKQAINQRRRAIYQQKKTTI